MVFGGYFTGIEAAVGTGTYNFYRLNGPYDPDTAVGSLQTPGLAAMAQLYGAMRVWNVRVSATGTVYCPASHPGAPVVTLIPTASQPVLPSNPTFWPVQRYSRSVPAISTACSATHNFFHFDVDGAFSLPGVLNVTTSQYRDEADYSSLTTSNPARQVYCAVALSGSCPLQLGIIACVRIEYDIEFFQPHPLQ